jgi:hypoxanthine phosphoribosyltransferase
MWNKIIISIRWLNTNREWIFSGIGVSVGAFLVKYLVFIKRIKIRRRSNLTIPEYVIDTTLAPNYRIPWDEMCKQIMKAAITRMKEDNWAPDVVLAVGRGGAVIGSIIASTMRVHDSRLPIVVLDVEYADKGASQQISLLSFHSDLFARKGRILIVDSNWQSGRTVSSLKALLHELDSSISIKCFALVWAPLSDELLQYRPDYYAYYSDSLMPSRLTFPWYL